MSYPPPNPYDPNQQQPGYGQPSPSQPPHYTTDADPYSRPDPYGNQGGYSPQMNVQPGSVPPHFTAPGGMPVGGPGAPPPGQAFQPGQAAPAPPGSSSNRPLIVTLCVVVAAVLVGGILIATMTGGGDDDGDTVATESSSAAEETTGGEPVEETSPAEEETTGGESDYRAPIEGECIENVEEGFYVVDCEAESAYWLVLLVAYSPEDADPDDPYHSVAANDACADTDWTQYYYVDTAVSAGREWDPEIDSITAIYCVQEV